MNRFDMLDWVDKDMSGHPSDNPEFPITTMTKAIARAVQSARPLIDEGGNGLDVGSGNGAISFVMASMGFASVQGLERCPEAVRPAVARRDRLSNIPQTSGWQMPAFIEGRLEADPLPEALNLKFRLMAFNPPAFFSATEVDEQKPLYTGLFTGTPAASGRGANPLQDFFAYLVAERLEPGGIAICTWPGIQSRQVYDDQTSIQHPAAILARRLGWHIKGAEGRSGASFYDQTSPVTYRDRGSMRLRRDIHWYLLSSHYSELVNRSNAEAGGVPTFAFGILALRRDLTDPNMFHLIDLGPAE